MKATTSKPTIYEALCQRLDREPTHKETCDEVRRILIEATRERAEAGKLRYQRKR